MSQQLPEHLPDAVHEPPAHQGRSSQLDDGAGRTIRVNKPGLLPWLLLNSEGLRTGWLIAIFMLLISVFLVAYQAIAEIVVHPILHLHLGKSGALVSAIDQIVQFLSLLSAGLIMARIERRKLVDYYLSGRRRLLQFGTGAFAGFVALSLLIGILDWAGYLRFRHPALSGFAILKYAGVWGLSFLLTGFFEEGAFRGYLQFTLSRGVNFWWALGITGSMCSAAWLNPDSHGALGVYLMASLALPPCIFVCWRRAPGRSFWLAAWVTSTGFGYVHTFNGGETWLGIFSAAAIGFLFCVSIRLTGSLWWAIGYHASWDWAQTYFFGTPDSGYVADGHYLTTAPVGKILWSGGNDGPEGSLLVLPVILLTFLFLLAVYGRKASHAAESVTGSAQPRLS